MRIIILLFLGSLELDFGKRVSVYIVHIHTPHLVSCETTCTVIFSSIDHVVMFHCLYTDSEKHFKVVVVSEMFEGMPLLKVCRVLNCLILRPHFQF